MATETGYAASKSIAIKRRASNEPDVFVDEQRMDIETLRAAARAIAIAEVSDAVSSALNQYGGSLRDLQAATGLDPAFVSKLAGGVNKQGATVASLAQIALAMNKSLKIVIE